MDIKLDLLDGDIILYQCAFSSAKDKEATHNGWNNFQAVATETESQAVRTEDEVKELVDDFMKELWLKTGGQRYQAFLSPSHADNYRTHVAKSQVYKGNRKKTELPVHFPFIKQYLIDRYQFIQLETIETDDMLGILQMHHAKKGEMIPTICTKDKDLKQIIGRNYNWVTEEAVDISKESAYHLLWKQMLTGDTVDNILGCADMEWTYWGSKKIIATSGVFSVVKVAKGEESQTNEFPSKAALNRHIDGLLEEGLTRQSMADYLHTTFGVTPVKRRIGVGEVEAIAILDEVMPSQYPTRVLVEYINRYGHFLGVNKYHETFNLVYILRDIVQAEYHGYEGGNLLENIPVTTWHTIVNNIIEEDDDEDEVF